jgi:tetratricopeptide (TPR) repeat protein
LLLEQGRFTESRKLLTEAEAVPGATIRQLVDAKVGIAELDRDTQNWEASAEEWKEAGEMARGSQDTVAEAACQRGLGQTWLDRGNAARAEPLLRSALALYQNLPAREGAQIASVLTSLGELYLAEDKTGLADEALQRALESEEKDFGPTHPQIAVVLELLADTVSRRNQMELARGYLDRAGKIMVGRFGAHSIVAASVFANWGTIEQRANQPERAAVQYEKALDALSDAAGDVNSYRVTVMTQYAQALKASHHKREAEEILAQAQGFRSK